MSENEVRPFCGFHYNPDKIKNLGDCLSQPYDVISPGQQEDYYKQHPYNIIRLILNKQEAGDNETANSYSRASDFLKSWMEQNIVHQHPQPAFWLYEQTYELEGSIRQLRGFIGAVRLQDYEQKLILPHEKVMINPVKDRGRLLEATQMLFESIWGLYREPNRIIRSVLDKHSQQKPLIDYYEAPCKVHHKFWSIDDPDDNRTIQNAFKQVKIYIADGHHRYQTMLNNRQMMRQRLPGAAVESSWEYIMMYLVNTEDEDLTILPYHRMIDNQFQADWASLLPAFETYFTVKKFAFTAADETTVRAKWLQELSRGGNYSAGIHSFGFCRKAENTYYLLTLKNIDDYLALVRENRSVDWKMLDVNILNFLVLEKLLGFTEEQLAQKINIDYTHDSTEALEKIRQGSMQMAFLLNPTPLEALMGLSETGEVLPRKSTFFYPKPVSGLVFYPLKPSPWTVTNGPDY